MDKTTLEFGTIFNGKQAQDFNRTEVEVRNPYTKELAGRIETTSLEQVERVMERTRQTKIRLTRRERYNILNKIANNIKEKSNEISYLITSESGLCLQDTLYEVNRAVDVLQFAAIQSLKDDSQVFPCDVSDHGRPRRIYTMREPFNLIAAITPFNHPLNQVVHKIAPAIATNNTVVLKPSIRTPLTAFYFGQLCLDCGLPSNMLNVVCGQDHEIAEALVKNDLVDLVSYTGGSKVGKKIASAAGYKRLILELGGSSAMIILSDANIDEAVRITMAGTFKNGGQRCSAIRRLLVHESLANEFSEKLAKKTAEIRYGDPFDPDTMMGTLISEESAIQIEKRVLNAIDRGARLLVGNKREGALYSPTVLDYVKNDYELVAQESFGPVAPIIRFETLEEAIKIANDTNYGLTGAVVSNHWPSIQKVITELETGTVNVNIEPSYRLEWSPFGGVKDSGLGDKEGVIEAMKGMTRVKTYSLPWDTP